MPERPLGITILAILAGLGGIGFLLLAAMVGALSAMIGMLGMGAEVPFLGIIAGFVMIFMGIFIILAVLYFAVAYGLWTGKGWAWTLSIILFVLDIILGLAMLPGGIVTIIIAVLIIWYLTRPHVKEFFGKAPATAPPPPPPP